MPKCQSKKSAENAAFECSELTENSHIVAGKSSYTVKVGSKIIKKFTFKNND